MNLVVQFEDVALVVIHEDLVELLFLRISSDYNLSVGAMSVVFCSDDYILKVNQTYLNHDYFTDIITFDYSEGGFISGDLIVSLDTVLSNAVLYDTVFEAELFRVLVHGFLHLCGLGDKGFDEIEVMRERESFYMKTCINPFVSRETN